MSTLEKFKRRVEEFLSRNGMAASRFGLLACNDPNFVLDLRRGRKPNPDLIDRVDNFMAEAAAAGEAVPTFPYPRAGCRVGT